MVNRPPLRRAILVVEDDGSYREILVQALKAHGFNVFEAKHGKDALAICEALHIDTIITDLFMPEMDGLDLSKAVLQSHPNIEVFFTSSVYPPKGKEAGIPSHRFIQKSLNFKEFVREFTQLLDEIKRCDEKKPIRLIS